MGRNKLSIKNRWLEKIWENNPIIALNILHTKEKEILPAYISKYNLACEKQIILSMIPNKQKEGWNYLEIKKKFQIIRVILTV